VAKNPENSRYQNSIKMLVCLSILDFYWRYISVIHLVFIAYNRKLEGCIVLNEHNTVFALSGPLYATGVFLGPSESSTQTASRSLQPFLQGSLGDRPTDTDRPTDHATRSLKSCVI